MSKGFTTEVKRGVDVEPVFANIKFNKGFKRFGLKGMLKTEIEMGLLALAHNLAKEQHRLLCHPLRKATNVLYRNY